MQGGEAMIYANQLAYDNACEPELSDYRESPMFAEFVECVTLELLAGRDCQGIDSKIFMIDLESSGGGYLMAADRVSKRVTEEQFEEFINE